MPQKFILHMLGRRQIREKVLQFIYAQHLNESPIETVDKQLSQSIEFIHHLYFYQINLLLAIQEEAEDRLETAKQKNFATEKEKNPNTKFIQNKLLEKLDNSKAFNDFISKHKELSWKNHNEFALQILKRLLASERYEKYSATETNDFEEDKHFIVKVFSRLIAENEDLIDWYESMHLTWADDFHIANSLTLKTLKAIEEDKEVAFFSIFKDREDEVFSKNLLHQTISHKDKYLKLIEERSNNWKLDRIALVDRMILCMAFCELEYFPKTPARVVINEYIELAKVFSTEKSNIFVNGILDKYTKELDSL